MGILSKIATVFVPKDESDEAALSGDLDELPEDDKERLETLVEGMVEDAGEDD
jgi:hypothetical protein